MALITDEVEATKLQLRNILVNAPLYELLRSLRGPKYVLQRVITLRESCLSQQHLYINPDTLDCLFTRIVKILSYTSFSKTVEWIYSLYLIYDCKWLLPDAQNFLETRVEVPVEYYKAAFMNVFGFIPDLTYNSYVLRAHLSISLRMASTLLPGQGEFIWQPPNSWSFPVLYANKFEAFLRSAWGPSLLPLLGLQEHQVAWWNAPLPPLTGYLADQLMSLLTPEAACLMPEVMSSPPTTGVGLHVTCVVAKLEDVEMSEVSQEVEFSAHVDTVVTSDSFIPDTTLPTPASTNNKRKRDDAHSSHQPECKYFKYSDEDCVVSCSVIPKIEENKPIFPPEPHPVGHSLTSDTENVVSSTSEAQYLDITNYTPQSNQDECVSPITPEPESHEPSPAFGLPDDYDEDVSVTNSGAPWGEWEESVLSDWENPSSSDSKLSVDKEECTFTEDSGLKSPDWDASSLSDWEEQFSALESESNEASITHEHINSEGEMSTASSHMRSPEEGESTLSDWGEPSSASLTSFTSKYQSPNDDDDETLTACSIGMYSQTSDVPLSDREVMELCYDSFMPSTSEQQTVEDYSSSSYKSVIPKDCFPLCSGKQKQCVCDTTDDEDQYVILVKARQARRMKKQARNLKRQRMD